MKFIILILEQTKMGIKNSSLIICKEESSSIASSQSMEIADDCDQQQFITISHQINKLQKQPMFQASKNKFQEQELVFPEAGSLKIMSKSLDLNVVQNGIAMPCKRRYSQLNEIRQDEDFQIEKGVPESILLEGGQLLEFIKEENVYDYYSIISKIKKGERGLIYKVEQKDTHCVKILKVVSKVSFREKFLIRGVCEIQNLLRVQHPGIVKLQAAFEDINQYYLIFQFIEGVNLLEFMKKHEVEEETGRSIIKQLLQILQCIHKSGVIHKNIKLQNVMVKYPYRKHAIQIKLIDFGMSLTIDQANQEVQTYGSIYYAPPESLEHKINTKYDIWSVGILTLILFLNTEPSKFWEDNYLHNFFRRGEPFKNHLKKLPTCIKQFVFELLTIKNKRRPSAAQALKIEWISGDKGEYKSHLRKGRDIDEELSLRP